MPIPHSGAQPGLPCIVKGEPAPVRAGRTFAHVARLEALHKRERPAVLA